MKIFPSIEQGSEEWKALRSQYFTASRLGDWLISPLTTKKDKQAWENAIVTRLGSISMDEEPDADTWAMKRGRELEPMARVEYEKQKGHHVHCVGFCAHDSDDFGCSPDGLISEAVLDLSEEPANPHWFRNGVEIKCHVARKHIGFLRNRESFREEHAMQVHASMAATGIKEWHLFGFHPELPPLLEHFEWNEWTDRVLAGLLKLSEDYWTAYAELKEMHTAEQSRRNKA